MPQPITAEDDIEKYPEESQSTKYTYISGPQLVLLKELLEDSHGPHSPHSLVNISTREYISNWY